MRDPANDHASLDASLVRRRTAAPQSVRARQPVRAPHTTRFATPAPEPATAVPTTTTDDSPADSVPADHQPPLERLMDALRQATAGWDAHPRATTPQPTAPESMTALADYGPAGAGVDLFDYWSLRRNGRRCPSAVELDPARLARDWPQAFEIASASLVTASSADALASIRQAWQRRPQARHMADACPATSGKPGTGEQGPVPPDACFDWLANLARTAARVGRAIDVSESFDSADGAGDRAEGASDRGGGRWRAVVLPLSASQTRIDSLLCQVTPGVAKSPLAG
ncbi:MAG: hypothetical protein RIE31_11475 [Alphaproteobacteria bacterium]